MSWKTCACFLPQQDQLVLRGKYSCEEGWQQLDMELSLPPADTPVLTDTYDGVQVQLEGTQATITLSPTPKTDQWGRHWHPGGTGAQLPHPWRL